VILEKTNTAISESYIEQNLSQIGHDKKKMIKKVIDFLQQNDNNADFEKIKKELSKSIKSYKHFESISSSSPKLRKTFVCVRK
jgi:hypothetical protein